jgi:hypothetical protein
MRGVGDVGDTMNLQVAFGVRVGPADPDAFAAEVLTNAPVVPFVLLMSFCTSGSLPLSVPLTYRGPRTDPSAVGIVSDWSYAVLVALLYSESCMAWNRWVAVALSPL